MKPAKVPSLQPRVQMARGNVNVAASFAWQDNRRASRHARGYGSAWDKRRLRILKRDSYLCQCQDCKGGELRLRPATHVDHIVSKAEWQVNRGSLDGVDHDSNLQSMNADCHARKTEADRLRVHAACGAAPRGMADVQVLPLSASELGGYRGGT